MRRGSLMRAVTLSGAPDGRPGSSTLPRRMRAEGPAERWTGRLLATLTVAFAAWTVAYHVAVAADLPSGVASAGAVALLAVFGLVALAVDRDAEDARGPGAVAAGDTAPHGRAGPLDVALLAVTLVAGVTGAALAAFTEAGWAAAWAPLAVAGAAAVALTLRAPVRDARWYAPESWPELVVVAAWAV